jgi:hypothetical protein
MTVNEPQLSPVIICENMVITSYCHQRIRTERLLLKYARIVHNALRPMLAHAKARVCSA